MNSKTAIVVGIAVGAAALVLLLILQSSSHDLQAASKPAPDPFASLEQKKTQLLDPLRPQEGQGTRPPKQTTLLDVVPPAQSTQLKKYTVHIADAAPRAAFEEAGAGAFIDKVDEVFLGRLDLYAHLRPGVSLDLWVDDHSELKGARLNTSWGTTTAALYSGPDASPGWYDDKGFSMAGPVLGRPIQLSRITSKFGQRLHPISGQVKNHNGTDYGIPTGTPVKVVADGTVKEASISASAGNYIKVLHADNYESWYLHLSSLHTVQGAKVKQGQEIGLSGNTGASTGPHLHYELHRFEIPYDSNKMLPLPTVALGPIARATHIKTLQVMQ